MKKIKYLDTFAGVGGFHLALEQSIGKENIECIGFSEIDKFAKQVYQEHFPNSKDLGDITQIDIENLPDFDLLTGGFPCQDVSVAGKQNLEGGRTVLVEYLLQILEKKQPKYFVFENVKGIYSKKFETFLWSIKKRINEAGYNLYVDILNTKDFGLPQNRERVFFIGTRFDIIGKYNFLEGQELTTFLKDILEEEVDEKYYLTDNQIKKLKYEDNYCNDNESIIIERGHGYFKGKRGNKKVLGTIRSNIQGNTLIDETIKIKNATKIGYIEGQEGDGIVLDNPNSKTKRGRVKHKISGTLTCAGSDGVIVKDLNIRKLTPIECERLQGFPDNWTDLVSNSQRYKQMGNAISIPVVKSIFDNLL